MPTAIATDQLTVQGTGRKRTVRAEGVGKVGEIYIHSHFPAGKPQWAFYTREVEPPYPWVTHRGWVQRGFGANEAEAKAGIVEAFNNPPAKNRAEEMELMRASL